MHRRILTLVTGAIGGQILAFATLPIISRLYTPDQMGSFQVMLALCNTLGIVTALSLERTLLLDLGRMRLATLRRLAGRTVVVTALASMPIYLLYAQIVPAAPMLVAGVPVVFFVGLTVFFRGSFLVEYTTAIAGEREKRASLAVFAKDLVRIGARIGLGLSAFNPVGLFIAVILDWATGTAVLWRHTRSTLRQRRGTLWRALRRYREYPFFYAPAAALTSLTSETPVLLLGTLYPARDVGLYGLAFLMLDRPSRIVAKAAGDVLTHRMARASVGQGRRAVVRNALLLAGLDLLALTGIAGTTWLIAGWLLGEEWIGVGLLAMACIPHALALFVSELSIGLFAAVARLSAGLARQVASVLALCLGFGLGYGMGWPVAGAVASAGSAHLLVQLGFLVQFARQFRAATPESGDPQ